MKELLTQVGLNDEQISGVLAAMKEAKVYTTKEENIDQRYAKLKTQKEDLKVKLDAANGTIEELKQSNLTNAELQAQVEAHKAKVLEIETAAAEKVRNLTLDNAINAKLGEFDSKYHALLIKAFDRDTMQVDGEGKITGLDEQYNLIKDTYKDLMTPSMSGRTPQNPTGASKGITKESFNEMSYNERMELFNTSPDAYKQLTEQ